MKVKLSDLLKMKPVIEKLIKQDVPVTVGYDLITLVRVFETQLKTFAELRKKLFTKYGKEDKEKKTTTIEKDKVKDFEKNMNQLLDKEIKIECKKIKISSLGDVKLSTSDLMVIDLLTEK